MSRFEEQIATTRIGNAGEAIADLSLGMRDPLLRRLRRSSFRMRIFDPNVHDGGDWDDAFFEEAAGFDVWIQAWASGVDLWDLMYGEKGSIAQIISTRSTLP